MFRHFKLWAPIVALSLLDCGKSAAKTTTTTAADIGTLGTVEIFTSWIAGGEAQALNNLIASYKTAYPGDDVLNSTATATAAGAVQAAFDTLNARLAANQPPDVWQAILGTNLVSYVQFIPAVASGTTAPTAVNKTENLTSLYASEGWTDKIPPGVLAAMKYGDGYYALPVDISRANDLFYNKAIFNKYGLMPPTTLAELWAVCAALIGQTDDNGDPIIPMVISAGYKDGSGNVVSAWPTRFLADAVLMAEPGGIQFRQDYYAGLSSPSDPLYVQAANDFNKLLTLYTNGGNTTISPLGSPTHALNLQWQDAADLLHKGQAAMFLNGDWVKAYLQSEGDVADVDFGAVEFPPKAFVYAGDSFVLASGAPHHDAAVNFLKLAGSAAVQSAFNKVKGSLPARTDADTSDYDSIGVQTAADFRDPTATLLPCSWDYAPIPYWTCWQDAVLTLIEKHDASAYASACVSTYSTLKTGQ